MCRTVFLVSFPILDAFFEYFLAPMTPCFSEEIIGKSRMWNEANEVGAEMERKLSSNKFAEKVCRIFVYFN